MECKGKIKAIFRDFRTGRFAMTLELEGVTEAQLQELDDKDLRLNLKRWREKRSLDANSYAWVLITEIARKIGSTKEEVYELFIQRNAPWAQDENGYIIITVKAEVDMSRIQGHWKRLKASEDGKWVSYAMLEGSSEFDSQTMSEFIDMIKDEAERLGIDTATPDEIERMKATWQRAS